MERDFLVRLPWEMVDEYVRCAFEAGAEAVREMVRQEKQGI